MARDYAKTHARDTWHFESASHHSRTKNNTPGWVWLLVGLLTGIMVAVLLPYKDRLLGIPTVASAPSPETSSSVTTTETEAETPAEVQFDFYTLLPSMEVAPEPAATDKSAAAANAKDLAFIVQVGAFRNFAQADNLKANLSLLGLDTPHIQTVTLANNDIWYRVYLGPFVKEKDAKAQLEALSEQNIVDAAVLKVKLEKKT